jgi:ubiquinone/menaquinone biosynthesis C-methylase UbiE
MLAVAALRDEQQGVREAGVRSYVHGVGEATQLPAASISLVTLSFLIHELPQAATVGTCV